MRRKRGSCHAASASTMAMLQDMFKICQTHITDVYDDDDDDKVITYKCLAFNVLVTLAS